jgi:Cu/Ag efflux protein CusF
VDRLAALVALLLAVPIGCGQPPDASAPTPPASAYQLRGVVRRISAPAAARTEIWIHHEAVPDFTGIDGEVTTMAVMTMPFLVAESVDISGIAPGTKLAFELTVDWQAPEPAQITAVEILPAETELSFENSR